jgi:hypothetical protein
MAIVKPKSVETPTVRKSLKKKQSTEEIVKPVEKVVVESVKKVKSVKKSEPKVEAVKETVKKSKKEIAVKVEKEEKAPKAAKKINNKPTLADTCGLNLSLAKVKNIISAKINLDTTLAAKDIQSFIIKVQPPKDEEGGKVTSDYTNVKLSALSAETREYLDLCREELFDLERLEYSRAATKDMSKADLAKYNAAKRVASAEFIKNQKSSDLFSNEKFDLTAFNTSYDKDFYSGMDATLIDLTKLKGAALHEQCMYFINKRKIRFNSESKIFITAFIEYIIKQLVINGTKCCINDKKKIIKLDHAIETVLPEFTMVPFIMSTPSYKKYVAKQDQDDDEEEEEEDVQEDDEVANANRKQQFKYYVSELCRNVRMELSAEDSDLEDTTLSKFNQTSVSKVFKQFCSDVIIDLLHMFGNVLKTEIETRNVKTVNYLIISALIQSSHMLHSLDSGETIQFIQERYNIYNEYISKRAVQRSEEKTAKECK